MTSAVVDSGGSILELPSNGVENQEVSHPMYYISVLFIKSMHELMNLKGNRYLRVEMYSAWDYISLSCVLM